MTYRFLLIDDHSIIRTGVALVLNDLYVSCVIDEAAGGDEGMEFVKQNNYDLVVLDLNMPHTDSASLISALLFRNPSLHILIFTMAAESIFAKHYLKMGVRGFISKDVSKDELKRAITQVMAGKTYLSQDMLFELSQAQLQDKSLNPFENLSKRELQLLTYFINGDGLSQIATSLNIGKSTVGTHKANIFEKLNVKNVIELRELARLYHLIK